MISTKKFYSIIIKNKINFMSGVPDSCLKNFLNYVEKKKIEKISAPNEGCAVSIGVGYYLKTKKIPLIYMQNSGFGNAIDPLTSLCAKQVYSIPLFMLIGWRGSPNMNDAPQHLMVGKTILKQLKLFKIKSCVIKKDSDLKNVSKLINYAKKNKTPVACLIEPKVFSKVNYKHKLRENKNFISRPEAISTILDNLKNKTKIVSTVGYTSRELHQLNKSKKKSLAKEFLMVGGMGHTATTSLGLSFKNDKDVICFDGDGSFLMHMGGIATAVIYSKNFKYVLFDNNSHESTGNQITLSNRLDFKKLAYGFGFKKYFKLENSKNYKNKLSKYINLKGKVFIHIKNKIGSLETLTRPSSLRNIKQNFMK